MSKPKTILLLALVLGIGFLTNGLSFIGLQVIDGPDIKIHFRWALQFAAALSEGVLYPRWASYSYFGLGDPTFLYMHPLYYYLVAAFNALSGNLWAAILAAGAVSTSASAAFTFFIARRYASASLAIAAAFAIAVSPYAFHLANYQQFLPMHFATPFLILYLGAVSTTKGKNRILFTAVPLALLIMSHVLTAFMALICTGVIVLFRAIRERDAGIRLLVEHGLGVSLGLALSAIYLFPALTTQNLITPAGWYAPIHLDWRNAFLFQYVTLPATGFRWFHLQWTIPLITILACGLSGCFLWLSPKISDTWRRSADMLAIAVLALLLGSEISYPLWEHVGILRRLQFPLRFLDVACIASVLSLVWSAACLAEFKERFVWLGIGLFLAGSTAMLGALERQFLIEARPALAVAEPGNTLGGQAEMKPASAGNDWKRYLDEGGFSTDCAALNLTCIETVSQTHHKIWSIQSETDNQTVRMPMLWFPGWEISVDGVVVQLPVDSATGLPIVKLGAGKTMIEARWMGIPQERVGAWISGLALLIAIGLTILAKKWSNEEDLAHVA